VGKIIHGMESSTEYHSWQGMKDRCFNPNSHKYNDYAGRGITVCNEWRNDFTAFYNHVGAKPTCDHTIDRINNNGNYEPGNVRWATVEEQQRNKRIYKTNNSGISGVYWRERDNRWIVKIASKYIGQYMDLFEACCARKSAEANQ